MTRNIRKAERLLEDAKYIISVARNELGADVRMGALALCLAEARMSVEQLEGELCSVAEHVQLIESMSAGEMSCIAE